MALKSHWWWDHSTLDFSQLKMDDIVAIQPVGAVEQHGPHLPVSVDATINAGIVERAVQLMAPNLPALVLPMLPVGKSNEHHAYPGTLSFSYETLARMWFEIGESVHRAGCRKIIFFNSHGGQPQVMEIVCRELRVKLGMLAVGASWFNTIDQSDMFSDREMLHGIHGGEVETSLMLHLKPQKVDMNFAQNFKPLSMQMEQEFEILRPDGAAGFGWESQDLHPAGVSGDAASADAVRGEEAVERAARALVKITQEVSDFPVSRLAKATAFNGLHRL
ncbi:creatininase family protein [Devosia sp. 2618]|uniref:creatininase family protein n=1 Tax=Devosia sp. 2618 TaxID=3156454 RepID=UPI00339A8977